MLEDVETDRQRVFERYRMGESAATIYASVGYSRKWIYKWLKRLEELEVHPLPSAIMIGRIHWCVTNSPDTARAAKSRGGKSTWNQFP
jgi:hypothetical protein